MREDELKKAILNSEFVAKIRHFEVDRDAFHALCHAISELTKFWEGKHRIDKELASELYVIKCVTEGAEFAMRRDSHANAALVSDMAVTLDGLILDCFNPNA